MFFAISARLHHQDRALRQERTRNNGLIRLLYLVIEIQNEFKVNKIMTHEERANDWFANIPHGKDIDLQTRMAICDRIGKKLLGVFFGIVALEIFILYLIGGAELLESIVDTVNGLGDNIHSRASRKATTLIFAVMSLPFLFLPFFAVFKFRKKWLIAEAEKFHKQNPK
jgi:hypothetical protein